jgi:hypothetical protein
MNSVKSMVQLLAGVLCACSLYGAPAKNPAGGGVGAIAPGAPQFSATFSKLFGEHKAFSAKMMTEVTEAQANSRFTTPCNVAFLDGKSRMEVDLAQSKGSNIPAEMAGHLKAMGMSEMVIISDPTKNMSYLVYPGLQSYAEIPGENNKPLDDSKIKVAVQELGKETAEGHACVKNKIMITDAEGKPEEATVWNATDLKKFPVRIDTADKDANARMTFTGVKFEKPDAKLFSPPANFKEYASLEAMIQEAVMKRMHGGGMPGMPRK